MSEQVDTVKAPGPLSSSIPSEQSLSRAEQGRSTCSFQAHLCAEVTWARRASGPKPERDRLRPLAHKAQDASQDDEPQGHLLLSLNHHNCLHHQFGLESGQEAPEPPSESQDWMEDQRVRGRETQGRKSQGGGQDGVRAKGTRKTEVVADGEKEREEQNGDWIYRTIPAI